MAAPDIASTLSHTHTDANPTKPPTINHSPTYPAQAPQQPALTLPTTPQSLTTDH